MFDVKCKAEIRNLNTRVEHHGDERVPAIDVKLMLLGIPVDRISSACPDIGERFYDGDMVAIGEVNPLTVGHKIENLTVKIGDREIGGCDIKKGAKIHLQPIKLANMEVTIQTENHGDLVQYVLELLKDEEMVSINERQLSLVNSQE